MGEKQTHTVLRFATVFLLVTVGFVTVLVKIVLLQTKEREHWLNYANRRVKNEQPIPPRRGQILDCQGRVLASSIPTYDLYMNPTDAHKRKGEDTLFLHHVDELAAALSEVLGLPTDSGYYPSADDYKNHLMRQYEQQSVRAKINLQNRYITYTERQELEQRCYLLQQTSGRSGLSFEAKERRIKPYHELAGRTIGDIYASSGEGYSGIEAAYEKTLGGIPGVGIRQRVGNRWTTVAIEPAVNGQDIVTTLDADLQDIVEGELLRTMQRTQGDWGCCAIMEVKTGKVRAIANLGRTSSGDYVENDNYAFNRYDPGSTFKTIAMLACLNTGRVSTKDTVSVTSKPWYYVTKNGRRANGIIDTHKMNGIITYHQALVSSSNIGLAKMVTRTFDGNTQDFINAIDRLGLRRALQWDVWRAQNALIEMPSKGDEVTIARMSYGYSVELSPMQIMMFYNGLANGGKMLRPNLIERIEQNGTVLRRIEPEVVCEQLCSPEVLHSIHAALHDVVWDDKHGTASCFNHNPKAQSAYVSIAGKTGTAQLYVKGENGKMTYTSTKHRISFVGYFPDDNPAYTCICVVHHPKQVGADSGADCGGTVRRIAEQVIALKGRYILQNGELKLSI